jgi:hypothetical protein
MANESPFTRESASRTDPVVGSTSTLLCGAGIDASTAGALTIGGTNATSIVMSAPVTLPTTQLGTLQFRSVTITHTTLDAAATSQAINIGDTLPANSMVVGVNVAITTATTGGGATSCVVDIGTSGDVDALIDGANVFAAAVDGMASSRPLGIAPNKLFVSAGAQLTATVISDVNVSLLTAGSFTITVAFVKIA